MKLSLVNLILFSSRRMPSESDKWGWKHVSVFGGFVKGSGTKRWTCNHCKGRYNGSYSRVRAHLLGFTGVGVKSCPAIDKSLREICRKLEEERVAKKRKKILGSDKIGKCIKNATINPLVPIGSISKDDVDEILARFFYADGLSMSIVQSPYFQEMAKALAAFGPGYEPPSADMLAGSFLRKEKSRIEKSLMLVRESWPHTGCTIFCVNCLDGSTGCFCINFFVSSPRGLVFLKMLDVKEGDGADNVFIDVLSQAIMDIGPTNVLQIITHLGQASSAFESVMLTKFPRIFWCHCTSHSIRVLMEEIFELDWMRAVVLCAKEIEQGVLKYQCSTRCIIPCDPNPPFDNACEKFAPSYYLVQRVLQMKQPLHELVSSDEWKHWKLTSPDDAMNIEAATLKDDFWARAKLMLQLCEPFVRSLDNIDKSVMGDVYHWRVQSLEAARTEGIDDIALNQLEMLIENRWDTLFSPLHSTGYILNPRYFGRDQNRDKTVMRGWKATLDRYEGDSSARRQLREQLSAYWRGEGCFGEEDAMECRDKMDPIAWWENFGYETPNLQRLAIKVLSQACSVSLCQDSWQCQSLPCPDSFSKLGVDKGEDLAFVRNNLRLQSQKSGNLSNLSLPRSRNSCCASGCGT